MTQSRLEAVLIILQGPLCPCSSRHPGQDVQRDKTLVRKLPVLVMSGTSPGGCL